MFAAARVFESFLGVNMYVTILVISIFTVTYTALGGLKAVVITENIQVCLLVGGAINGNRSQFDGSPRDSRACWPPAWPPP